MNKTWKTILIILLIIIAALVIYLIIKKRKTEKAENNGEASKDSKDINQDEPKDAEKDKTVAEMSDAAITENVESRSCVNKQEPEPFTADGEIIIDPAQSRTTEEYVEWQKENNGTTDKQE